MKDAVTRFSEEKSNLLKYFNCPDDYFIKTMDNLKWTVIDDDGIYFLKYWDKNKEEVSAVIITKNEKPLIYRKGKHVMIVAIDCVKIGFVFQKDYNIKPI